MCDVTHPYETQCATTSRERVRTPTHIRHWATMRNLKLGFLHGPVSLANEIYISRALLFTKESDNTGSLHLDVTPQW